MTQQPPHRKEILKTLVGSRAHELHNEDSDYDYRGVFICPTVEMLKLGGTGYHPVSWMEGEREDDTAYEIGHFLHLATKSNPSILEVFKGPVVSITKEGIALKQLFPHVWSARGVHDAFHGYSHNQFKKMFDKDQSEERKRKYAVAYLRVLTEGITLLTTGDFDIVVPLKDREFLLRIKQGQVTVGEVVDRAEALKMRLNNAFTQRANKVSDIDKVNKFLLRIRKSHWEF